MHVYFIRTRDNAQLVKIGYARDVPARLAALQTGCPSRLEILATAECRSVSHAVSVERMLHNAFAHLRVRGEWFRMSKDLRAYAKGVVDRDEKACAAALEANSSVRKRELPHKRHADSRACL